jgi:nitrate reductase gamma subunit
MTTNLLIIFGGMALFVTIIGTMDLIGRRQQRKAQKRSSL